jgi:hypothetical protein
MKNLQQTRTVLAHWTYTRAEWKQFEKWKQRKRGYFFWLVNSLFFKNAVTVPDITVTAKKIWIGDEAVSFADATVMLKRISVLDAAGQNIVELTIEKNMGNGYSLQEICIPVPKGKLREAMLVQEVLSSL